MGIPRKDIVSWRWMRVITVEPRSEASRERARLRDASRKRRWITGCSEARIMKSHRILIGSITIQYTLSLLRLGNPLTQAPPTAPSGPLAPRGAPAGSPRLVSTQARAALRTPLPPIGAPLGPQARLAPPRPMDGVGQRRIRPRRIR